jgi:rsbT co-antagonist protein RsbR
VLQIRDQLLLVPLIGVLDTSRARLLTEQLLTAIRTHRARLVVIDITGVAAVDSKVANHIFQTVAAVKLMGARTIITGVSSDVAEALVALGVNVDRLDTVSDLQGGLDEANRMLGVKLVRNED